MTQTSFSCKISTFNQTMEQDMPAPEKEFSVQTVLELSCAAYRHNKDYIKTTEPIYTDDYKVVGYKHTNKVLMLTVLGEDKTNYSGMDPLMKPPLITNNLEDKELAEEIIKFYRRLMFSAIEGSDDFKTELNSILTKETTTVNKFGWIACLPSVYKRDISKHQFEKKTKSLEEGWLGEIGNTLMDLDCEILSSIKSKNFEAFNIDAIINNKLVSWMSQKDLIVGPAVVIKAKVKDHGFHWKTKGTVTRLNYVKVAQ